MKKITHFQSLILSLFISFSVCTAAAETFHAKVTEIHDGDTVNVVFPDGKKGRVRLVGTDSPEVDFKNNSQGSVAFAARDYLISMLPLGSEITIETDEQVADKHDRLLGTIIYNGLDLNEEMLKQGWSAFYVIAPFDKTLVKEYSAASKEAYQKKIGIFSAQYKNTVMPYIFRLQKSGQRGRNLVGDVETRKLHSSEEVDVVPPYSRVFFPSENMALQKGYQW